LNGGGERPIVAYAVWDVPHESSKEVLPIEGSAIVLPMPKTTGLS